VKKRVDWMHAQHQAEIPTSITGEDHAAAAAALAAATAALQAAAWKGITHSPFVMLPLLPRLHTIVKAVLSVLTWLT
jgi:hypothetical protein